MNYKANTSFTSLYSREGKYNGRIISPLYNHIDPLYQVVSNLSKKIRDPPTIKYQSGIRGDQTQMDTGLRKKTTVSKQEQSQYLFG